MRINRKRLPRGRSGNKACGQLATVTRKFVHLEAVLAKLQEVQSSSLVARDDGTDSLVHPTSQYASKSSLPQPEHFIATQFWAGLEEAVKGLRDFLVETAAADDEQDNQGQGTECEALEPQSTPTFVVVDCTDGDETRMSFTSALFENVSERSRSS